MAAVASDITVTFDENYKVRVLDAERFKQTEALETECNEFVKRMDALRLAVQEFLFPDHSLLCAVTPLSLAGIRTFNGTVRSLVEVLSKQASAIETAKLRVLFQGGLFPSLVHNTCGMPDSCALPLSRLALRCFLFCRLLLLLLSFSRVARQLACGMR